MKKEREQLGPFIITNESNIDPDNLLCNYCEKVIAKSSKDSDSLDPPVEELIKLGNVAVPNFGWFCSQKCGKNYSIKYNVNFKKDTDGNINYYD
jgi:hypothetical protein